MKSFISGLCGFLSYFIDRHIYRNFFLHLTLPLWKITFSRISASHLVWSPVRSFIICQFFAWHVLVGFCVILYRLFTTNHPENFLVSWTYPSGAPLDYKLEELFSGKFPGGFFAIILLRTFLINVWEKNSRAFLKICTAADKLYVLCIACKHNSHCIPIFMIAPDHHICLVGVCRTMSGIICATNNGWDIISKRMRKEQIKLEYLEENTKL